MADLSSYIYIAANTVTAANVSATGNVVSNSAVSTTGNVTGGNIVSGGVANITGNVTGANLIAGSSGQGNVYAGNVIVNGQPTTYGVVNPDYITAGRITSDQTGVGSDSDIIFNGSIVSSGITLNTSTGVFTLTAGKTYRISATFSWNNFGDTTNGYLIYNWVDATTNTALDATGSSKGVAIPINRNANEFNNSSCNLIYTPSTNQTIKVRVVETNTTATLRSAVGTTAIIEQINPTIAVQATATGTVAKNYAKYTRTASQSVSANSVIICNVLENTSGTAASVNTSTGQVTLTAGTYRLRGTAGTIVGSAASSSIAYGWYNETTSAWVGEGAGWSSPSSTNWNSTTSGTAEYVITVASTSVVSFRVIAVSNVTSIGGNGSDFAGTYANPWIDIEQMGATFALNTLDTMSATGNISANNFTGNGGGLSNVATKTTGSWTLAAGTNTVNISVPLNGTYSIWVNGNIPNGIITYTATAVVTNTNVPVLGEQYAWYYAVGNALVLTSIPNQFTGTVGSISNVNTYLGNTANVFTFGITNNSGNTAVVNYGYTKL
jgi:hypothetical protein